jgi:potassium/hydrogen antiporter
MAHMNEVILFGSLLMLLAILASALSARFGAPLLLVFLVLGMLAGEDGPGGIPFDDVHLAQFVGSIALAIIIFDGGLRTRAEVFRVALWPSISLATVGVILTASLVGAVATWLLGLHWMQGLLLGAIIGSTDAAAVFSLLNTSGTRLKERVAATLEIESASNDPMAIFLTMAIVGLLAAGRTELTPGVLLYFVQQFGVGAAVGWAGGRILGAIINRINLVTGLFPLLAAVGGMSVFGIAAVMDGSGFLAIYVCGVVLGNMPLQASQNILRVHDGLAWLSQITMFLMLGLLITPRQLLPIAWEGFVIAVALMMVARPVAVLASLLPFRFPWREQAFISWVGLRGAVPMILAIFPLTAGLEHASLYFHIAFFVILSSLVVQGWTIAPVARLLRLEIPPTADPLQRFNLDTPGHLDREIACYAVARGSAVARRALGELPLPPECQVASVIRDDKVLPFEAALRLAPGDLVYVFTEPKAIAALNRLFDPHAGPQRLDEQLFYGYFTLDAAARLGDVADAYGLSADVAARDLSLAEFMTRRFHGRPVPGDRAGLGKAELIVRATDGVRVTKVGLKLLPRS